MWAGRGIASPAHRPGLTASPATPKITGCGHELLDRLSPSSRYITLKNGQTLPVVAVQLALDLERRGIPLHTDANHQFIMPDDERLTDSDRRAIERWRLHLSAIVEYEAPKIA